MKPFAGELQFVASKEDGVDGIIDVESFVFGKNEPKLKFRLSADFQDGDTYVVESEAYLREGVYVSPKVIPVIRQGAAFPCVIEFVVTEVNGCLGISGLWKDPHQQHYPFSGLLEPMDLSRRRK